ncbi:MAG TPA: type II toxin-antitoxin system RelE/ParE family toxin [Oculatellaceae cyanobacterium]
MRRKSGKTPIVQKKTTKWYTERLRQEVAAWPKAVREDVGGQLNKVEYGGEPDDFKPMPTVGSGVNEIRVADDGLQYRLIYIAKFEEAVYVLHVITKKKTQKTSTHDIQLAKQRYGELVQMRKLQAGAEKKKS